MSMRIAIVGRGSLGTLLGRLLRANGIAVRTTRGRAPSPATIRWASVVVLAVPDPSIAEVAGTIAGAIAARAVVLHVAGARTVVDLDTVASVGASVGVMHPLVSFARGARPTGFERTVFVIDGDRAAIRAGARIARTLGARPVTAAVHGATYHATAALVANGAVGLLNEAARVLETLGFERDEASAALAGLLGTVVGNVRDVGLPEALTGPIARGDAATVLAHRRALAGRFAPALAAYDGVAPAILRCAVDRGLEDQRAAEIREALAARLTPRRRR